MNASSDGLAAAVTGSAGFVVPAHWFCASLAGGVLEGYFCLVTAEGEVFGDTLPWQQGGGRAPAHLQLQAR